jgi:hypothetical protein
MVKLLDGRQTESGLSRLGPYMRNPFVILLLAAVVFSQTSTPEIPPNDTVRIREFYRLATQVQDEVWPGWSGTTAPLLLVTEDAEFLTHHPSPPKDFQKVPGDLYSRPRRFPTTLLATFPAFGPPSVIVIGEPENTEAKTSTPWLFTVMHEHFHQLQDSRPDFYQAVNNLGLSHGDNTGMWMLNYPFPYDKPEHGKSFTQLRDLLLTALNEPDLRKFKALTRRYIIARKAFFAQLSPNDRKYLSFQLWKEGIARYVQIKCAEAAANYQPTPEYAALPDYKPFGSYAREARSDTLSELKKADLAAWKRVVVYSFGASEGLLLDRLLPKWKQSYFQQLFTLDPYFEN